MGLAMSMLMSMPMLMPVVMLRAAVVMIVRCHPPIMPWPGPPRDSELPERNGA
jgi:hypothetical protein